MTKTIDELKAIHGEKAVGDTMHSLVAVFDDNAYKHMSSERFEKMLDIAEDLRDAICYPNND